MNLFLFAISSFCLQLCYHQAAAKVQWEPTIADAQRSIGAGRDVMECFRVEGESCQDPVLGLIGQCPCDLGLQCLYNVCVRLQTNNDPSNMGSDYPSVGESNPEQPNLYYDE